MQSVAAPCSLIALSARSLACCFPSSQTCPAGQVANTSSASAMITLLGSSSMSTLCAFSGQMVHTVNARMGIADLNAMMSAALRGSEAEEQCQFQRELC